MPLSPAKILALMESKGITRAELARRTGIKPPHISRLLASDGDTLLSTAEKVADALRVTVDQLRV
jgi:transcriptional regulator with XRE-family HTH domain